MIQKAKARLQWLKPMVTNGSDPRGRQFTVPARFEEQGDDWTDNAWSLVVEPTAEPDAQGMQQALVHFLVPNAPSEWLMCGHKFTLQDGRTAIASGEIL